MTEDKNVGWKKIDSAPQNGEWVLCAWKNGVGHFGIPIVMYRHRSGYWTDIDPGLIPACDRVTPTHWMPLPPNPVEI